MLHYVQILCLVPVLSWAKPHCCTPDQWEAFASTETTTFTHGTPSVVDMIVPKISVDFKANKLAVQEIITSGSLKMNVTSIVDYKAGFLWLITYSPGPTKCVKYPVPPGGMKQCIPPEFKYNGPLVWGLGSNTISIDVYTWANESALTNILVTSDMCAPVTEYVRMGGSNPSVASIAFFNITAGIRDPSVFTVPAICHQGDLKGNLTSMIEQEEPRLSKTGHYLLKRFSIME